MWLSFIWTIRWGGWPDFLQDPFSLYHPIVQAQWTRWQIGETQSSTPLCYSLYPLSSNPTTRHWMWLLPEFAEVSLQLKPWCHYLLALWCWTGYLISLFLSSLSCRVIMWIKGNITCKTYIAWHLLNIKCVIYCCYYNKDVIQTKSAEDRRD